MSKKTVSNVTNLLKLTICLIIILLANPIYSQLADSPWPMFHKDLEHTGRSSYNGPDVPNLKWIYQTASSNSYSCYSNPVIDTDGTIYIGSKDSYLYAINSDGTIKWKFQTGSTIKYSTPAIGSDGTIYVGSNDHYLYAINSNGTLKWKLQTGGYVSSPAIGTDGTIYVGNFDSYLYAINENGTLKWKFDTGYYVTPPAIDTDGTIYIGSEDLYAINPDGTQKWKCILSSDGLAPPTLGSDGTIYVGSGESGEYYLYAVNPNGTLKWNFYTGGKVYSTPAIDTDGTIYVGSFNNHYLYAINPDGTEKWKFLTGGTVNSSPAIGLDGTIYVGSYDRYLYALNPNGTLKWNFLTLDWIYSLPAIGSDGKIYVKTCDIYLYEIGESTSPPPSLDKYVTTTGSNLTGDGSYEKPWKTITYAISQITGTSANPITIHISSGTYNLALGESFPINLESYVSLKGSNKTTTIIDATGANNLVLLCTSIYNLSIEGLTVTGGYHNNDGGGIYCTNTIMTINDCIFKENVTTGALGHGAGINCQYSSSVTITNCEIINNTAMGASAGGIQIEDSEIYISNCIINNNTALHDGGGLKILVSNGSVLDTEIKYNQSGLIGGGIICVNNSSPTITNCNISNNIVNGSSPIFSHGGGIACNDYSSPLITYCIIENNSATFKGGGIYCLNNANPTINYCEIICNYSISGSFEDYGVFNETNSCLDAEYNWWGSNEGANTPDGNNCGCSGTNYNANNAVNQWVNYGYYLEAPPDAITLESFSAYLKGSNVILEWVTGTEIDNFGFYVVRSEYIDSGYIILNEKLIPAQGSTFSGGTYSYVNNTVKSGHVYYYWLADVDIYGLFTIHGPVKVITNLETLVPLLPKE